MNRSGLRRVGLVIVPLAAAVTFCLLALRREAPEQKVPLRGKIAIPDATGSAAPAPTLAQAPAEAATPAPVAVLPELSGIFRAERLEPADGGFVYDNQVYGLRMTRGAVTYVTAAGVPGVGKPRLDYRLERLTMGGDTLASGGSAMPTADATGKVLSYRRGVVEEQYLLGERAVEQIFVVRELPAKRSAITVTGTVASNLTPPADGTAAGTLRFTHEGKEYLSVSEAVAVDAEGRRMPLDLSYADGRMSMVVPEDWVRSAALPIRIDPLVGSPVTVTANNQATNPAVSYNSYLNEWLVIWPLQTGGAALNEIRARRVSATGSLLGSELVLASSTTQILAAPALSYAYPGNEYLAVWYETPVGGSQGSPHIIKGKVLNTDASPITGIFTVDTRTGIFQDPAVAFDGTNWFVVFVDVDTVARLDNLRGRFVSLGGVPGATADPDLDPDTAQYPSVAFSGGVYGISWQKQNSTTSVIVARTMSPAGQYLTPTTTVSQGTAWAGGARISGSASSSFLIAWSQAVGTGPQQIQGRLVTSTLSFPGNAFVFETNVLNQVRPNLAYSSTSGRWVVAYDQYEAGMSFVDHTRVLGVDVTGARFASELVADAGFPGAVSWNSATNQVLIVYRNGGGLQGQRYGVPVPPIRPVPTGLAATGQNSRVSLVWNTASGATGYTVYRSLSATGPYFAIAETTGPSYVDPDRINGTPYFYRVAAFNGTGASDPCAQVSATPGTAALQALFVSAAAVPAAGSADAAAVARLSGMGYQVVTKPAAGTGAAMTADANGKALVVISSTITSGDVAAKFRNVVTPVLTWENALFQSAYLGMTGPTSATDFGTQGNFTQISMDPANSAHPLAAGLSGTALPVCTTAGAFSWGKPNANAVRIASLTADASKAVLFGYDKGAVMPGLTAPGRRVGFFMTDGTASTLTANGQKLFDAAVRWLTDAPPTPSALTVQVLDGQAILSWGTSPGALSYNIFRSVNGGAFTLYKSGISGCGYLDTGLTNGSTYGYLVVAVGEAGISAATAMVQAAPARGKAVSAITGPNYLRAWKQGDTPAWSEQGTYTVKIRKQNPADGSIRDLSADGTTVTSSTWSLTNGAVATILARRLTSCDVQTTQTKGSTLIYYDAVLSDGNRVSEVAELKSNNQFRAQVSFRFPENSPGRSTINADFFVGGTATLDDRRQKARFNLVASANASPPGVYFTLDRIWNKTTSVDFYMNTDYTYGLADNTLPGANFDAMGRMLTSIVVNGRSRATPAFAALEDATRFKDSINIYQVQQLAPQPAERVGDPPITPDGVSLRIYSTIITVHDSAFTGRRPETYAHEIGHCLGLDDLRLASEVNGLNNNHGRIYRPGGAPVGNDPLDYYVMKYSTAVVRTDLWPRDIDSFTVRLRMISHPARAKWLER